MSGRAGIESDIILEVVASTRVTYETITAQDHDLHVDRRRPGKVLVYNILIMSMNVASSPVLLFT